MLECIIMRYFVMQNFTQRRAVPTGVFCLRTRRSKATPTHLKHSVAGVGVIHCRYRLCDARQSDAANCLHSLRPIKTNQDLLEGSAFSGPHCTGVFSLRLLVAYLC